MLNFSWDSQEVPSNLVPIWLPYTHDRQTDFSATGVTDQSKL